MGFMAAIYTAFTAFYKNEINCINSTKFVQNPGLTAYVSHPKQPLGND